MHNVSGAHFIVECYVLIVAVGVLGRFLFHWWQKMPLWVALLMAGSPLLVALFR